MEPTDYQKQQIEELYPQAVEVTRERGLGSTAYLQRKLRIGYIVAANLIDKMIENGVLGPNRSPKPYEVLPIKK